MGLIVAALLIAKHVHGGGGFGNDESAVPSAIYSSVKIGEHK